MRNNCVLLFYVALVVAAFFAVSGGVGAAEYSFGVLSQRSAVLTAQYWNPILEEASARSGAPLALKIARTAVESNEQIAAGAYDFVYSNTIFLPSATGYQVILRSRTDAISGQIVTLKDSPIHSLAELNGQETGFPSSGAFLGYLVPMDHLRRNGIQVFPVFGGNQEGIMGQLKAGKVPAAGVNSYVMRAFAAREGVAYRVLWESAPFHNIPIAVHARVPADVVAAVQAAFIAMSDDAAGQEIFAAAGGLIGQEPPYGFLKSSQQDYAGYVDFYRTTVVKDMR
jgi:phosphonate transport system substrate-binding protein